MRESPFGKASVLFKTTHIGEGDAEGEGVLSALTAKEADIEVKLVS